MNKTLDTKTETEVVAYIARGDTYDGIIKVLNERGITITKPTLSNIKSRNSEALQYMRDAMAENQLSHASSILRKSRQLLENKLDKQLNIQHELDDLTDAYHNGEFQFSEYLEMYERVLKRELTATELNSITKESFNQSQVEQGKPSTITESPAQARKNLELILSAIANGDDRGAIEALFLDA